MNYDVAPHETHAPGGLVFLALICLLGLLVFASSIWVYFDATKIGVRRTGEKAQTGRFHVDMGPVGWMICSLLLWIVAFPAYIIKRPEFVRRFQANEQAGAATVLKQPDFEEQLIKLARLKDSGILTETEFDQKKKEILSR